MGKELLVREMPGAGTDVSHGIDGSREETVVGHVAKVALVQGLQAEEVGSRSCGCCGTFLLPSYGRSVVGEGVCSLLADIGVLGQDVTVGQGPGEFQIAVGDGSAWVGEGDEVGGDGRWKGRPPQKGEDPALGGAGDKMDSSHADGRGVARSQGVGMEVAHQFDDPGGTRMEAARQPAPVRQKVMDMVGESEAMAIFIGVSERLLECTEESPCARDPRGHRPEFPKELVPRAPRDATLAWWDGVQKFVEPHGAMRR